MAKLPELCEIQYGYAFDSACFTEDNTNLPLVRIRDVKRGYSETFYSGNYPSDYVIDSGSLLVGMDGEFNIARWKGGHALLNQRVCKITAKENVNEEYIRLALSKALKKIENRTAFATVKHLSAKELNQLEIDIPNYTTQMVVAKVLTQIESIISARQQQLQKLDELVKARFIELFGDPLGNDKGWQKALIAEVCNAIFGGGTPSKSHPEYFAGSIPWVSPKDMKSSVINDSIDHITEEAIAHSTTNLVPANSVLMVIRSGILKHTLPVAVNSLPVTINQDMKAFVPNETVKTAFLLYFFKAIENDVLAGVRGVTADNIDFKAFQKRTIIVPPLALQEQFVAFVTQADKSKVAVQKALDEAQLLFDSLMQKYFG